MKKLVYIPDMLPIINNPEIKEVEKLRNVNIFSRIKIPDTTKDSKNYVCFNFNSRIWGRNKDLKQISFDVVIMCHESNINTKYGNRHDVLAGMIAEDFSWSRFLGFELELMSDIESQSNNFYTRTLTFQNLSQNNLTSGGKLDGY